MRITTQMMNESSRRAGLPVNRTSLLNYVNGSDSGNNLLSALKEKKAKEVSSAQKDSFEKLEKASDELNKTAGLLTLEEKNSIFEKAEESGNNEEIYDAAEELVENYNNTLKALRDTPNTLNQFYTQGLVELAREHSEALGAIGITVGKNGSLSVDRNKLESADLETLEKTLGKDSDFTKKLAFLSERISDNAGANLESMSSQYSADGSAYSALMNKYNFHA